MTEKKLTFFNLFYTAHLILQFYRGGPMVYFKKRYIFLRIQRGPIFWGVVGVHMLISIETYRT